MGTKIKLLLFLLLLISNFSYSQSIKDIRILKKYALYKCISNNYYAVDSTFNSHDYTSSYIFQVKSIDYELLDKIDRYVKISTSKYYKNGIMENFEDKKANYICWHCSTFYESKDLDVFLKRLLKK